MRDKLSEIVYIAGLVFLFTVGYFIGWLNDDCIEKKVDEQELLDKFHEIDSINKENIHTISECIAISKRIKENIHTISEYITISKRIIAVPDSNVTITVKTVMYDTTGYVRPIKIQNKGYEEPIR